MNTDITPASFVVRNANYPQVLGYADFCVEATNALLKNKPQSFNEVCETISQMMKEAHENTAGKLFEGTHNEENFIRGFGDKRNPSSVFVTHLSHSASSDDIKWRSYGRKYLARHYPVSTVGGLTAGIDLPECASEIPKICLQLGLAISRLFPPLQKLQQPTFKHDTIIIPKDSRFTGQKEDETERSMQIKLGSIEGYHRQNAFDDFTSYFVTVNHSTLEPIQKNVRKKRENPSAQAHEQAEDTNEHAWAYLQQNFMKALKLGKYFENVSKQEQVEAAASCYCLISKTVPYYRGSATLARITLEYLAKEGEFDVPFTKKKVDLNLEAITLPHDEFVKRLSSDILQGTSYFSDHKSTSDEIMAWHKMQAVAPSQSIWSL